MKKTLLFFILCSLVLFLFISGCTEEKTLPTGDDFSFTTLTGETKHLSDYRGTVVILDMWATWCTPCQYQMLELRKIYQNYSRDDVEILSIDIDQRETGQQIQSFLDQFRQYGYELTWVFGEDDGTVWDAYKVGDGGIPALCIFSRNGTLSFSHEGLAVYNEIPQEFPDDLIKLAPVIESLL
jgi:thiol-disulfide isomerase/thioredoxin